MRIITLNLNGIRSAFRKGLGEWLTEQKADVVCLQELKALDADLTDEMRAPAGLNSTFSFAERKGYSGVGIYSKRKPKAVRLFGDPLLDSEGRFIEAEFPNFTAVSLYLPSGSSGEERQAIKYRIMDIMRPWLERAAASGKEYLVCGDWNIAHTEKDIRNWRGNLKNSGFLPEERAWIGSLFEDVGWVDVFRRLNQDDGQYTWWSNRGRAWEKNVGWRIDYVVATPGIAKRARAESICREPRFSDHAPLTIDFR